jgi:chromosome segregation ATPase
MPYTDGHLTSSQVVLQKFSTIPAITLRHYPAARGEIQIELAGTALVDACALVHAVFALCPTARDKFFSEKSGRLTEAVALYPGRSEWSEEQLAAARADKARLDWLEENVSQLWSIEGRVRFADETLRQAIDGIAETSTATPENKTPRADIIAELKSEAAEWQKCEEAIDSDASLNLSKLLRAAATEIERLRSETLRLTERIAQLESDLESASEQIRGEDN